MQTTDSSAERIRQFLEVAKKALEEGPANEYCKRDGSIDFGQVKKVYGCVTWAPFPPFYVSTLLIVPGGIIRHVIDMPDRQCTIINLEELKTYLDKIKSRRHRILIFDKPLRSEVAYIICTSPP